MHPPMMYQDLTTRALIEHAARYHSDTGIVSVGTLGGREYSTWGEVADTPGIWPPPCIGWISRQAPAAARWRGIIAVIWKSILASVLGDG